jgi:DNA-binding LacI/PurR family transcriptional regulator
LSTTKLPYRIIAKLDEGTRTLHAADEVEAREVVKNLLARGHREITVLSLDTTTYTYHPIRRKYL